MVAIKKKDIEELEKKYGLSDDGMTYQQRLSRITAYEKGQGESWQPPVKKPRQTKGKLNPEDAAKGHHLYGKKLLITPLMTPDKNRNLAFDEPIGHDIQVRDASAGEMIYGAPEEVDRMVGDYVIVSEDKHKTITAKTTFPKIGTEITWVLGKQLCPVARGNDGQKGYVWSLPTQMVQVDNTMIQIYGLKTLIEQVWPELLPRFSGKPMMSYVDGVTLVASIPLTNALLKEKREKELVNAKAGIN